MQRFVFALAAAAVAACVPKNGRLEVNRFQHEEYPYAVFYADQGDQLAPLAGSWRVDNFVVPQGRTQYVLKKGPEYQTLRKYDVNGDGQPDHEEREFFYDLLLEHTGKDAALWVRTVPISTDDGDKELAVFAERYVESVAGAGSVAVRFGAEGPVGFVQRRYASRLLQTQACSVSKREAYRVDFEVANVDQLELSEHARWKRGSVVFVRSGYLHRVHSPRTKAVADYPVLMVIGLEARPLDFASFEPDFERLLKQTVLGEAGKGLSMNGETTCQGLPGEASAGAEALSPSAGELNEEASQVPLAPEAMPGQGEAAPGAPAAAP